MAGSQTDRFDIVLVGGGLQNALILLAVLHHRPASRILMVEQDSRLGGNHTWSFHTDVLAEQDWPFVEPLIVGRWPRHRVMFPETDRTLEQPYATILSDRLHEVVLERLAAHAGCRLLTDVAASEVGAHQIRLVDGRRFDADLVVDARGPERLPAIGANGYQKFVGLEFRLEQPSPVTTPWLMDARVPQNDGFRFFYVLPFDAHQVLIEDTYYSDSPDLDRERLREEILAYARRHGLATAAVVREESGVLPIPLQRITAPSTRSPLVAGYAGGWFHATTGYSFPIALRLARHIATRAPEQVFDEDYQRTAREHQRQNRFCLLLNRMMFQAFAPEQRYSPLARFYSLPDPTVLRFYALSMTAWDRARVLVGRPPGGFSLRRWLSRGGS